MCDRGLGLRRRTPDAIIGVELGDRLWRPRVFDRPPLSNLVSMKAPLRNLIWVGGLVVSIASVAIASDDHQVVIDGPRKQLAHKWRLPVFDSADDIVDQWVENGRQFMNRNGKTCTCPRCKL